MPRDQGRRPFRLQRTAKPALRRLRSRLAGLLPGHIPIAYKLSLTIGMLMVIIISLMATLVVRYQQDALSQQIDELGSSLAAQMAQSASEPLLAGDQLGLDVLTTNVSTHSNILGTAILDPDGNPVATAGILPPLDGLTGPLPQLGKPWYYRDAATRDTIQLISYSYPIFVQDVIAGSVLITLDHSTWAHAVDNAYRAIIGTGIAVLLIGGLLTVWLSRRLSQPIYDLMSFTTAIDQGSYDQQPAGRRSDEFGHLIAAFNRFAVGMKQKDQAETTLERYLSPKLARTLLSGSQPTLGGERVEASVLFADIVGFTGMAEGMRPEAVANLLNQYFTMIARTAESYGGMIDKYIGDCAMLLFGAPQSDPDHAFHAACCTLAIRDLVDQMNEAREQQGHAPIRFRFGLNSGPMHAGNMGAEVRMEYTVVGEAVNLASRLAGAGEGSKILVTEEFMRQASVKDRIEAHPHRIMQIRGFSDSIQTHLIDGLKPGFKEEYKRHVSQLWWQSLKDSA